jgi:hypothetical protein
MHAPSPSVPPCLFLPTGGSQPLSCQYQHVPQTLHKYTQGVSELHAFTSVSSFAIKSGEFHRTKNVSVRPNQQRPDFADSTIQLLDTVPLRRLPSLSNRLAVIQLRLSESGVFLCLGCANDVERHFSSGKARKVLSTPMMEPTGGTLERCCTPMMECSGGTRGICCTSMMECLGDTQEV